MRRVKFLLVLLPAIILLVCPSKALADSHTFGAVKDTYANQAYPDNVYGSMNHIIISNKFTTRLGYVWFDDVNLPEGATLNQAILKFYVYELHYSDRAKINIGLCTNEWNEAAVTWNNKPLINQGSAIEAEIPLVDVGWREINITPLVQKWLDGDQDNKGIFIYPLGYLYGTAETEYAFGFRTRESGNTSPNLYVEYSLAPTPTLEPTPTPTPKATPTSEASPTPSIEPEEEAPTPEETPTPTPEEEGKGLILGTFTPFQAFGGGLILLGVLGIGAGLVLFARRKKKKKPKEPKKPASAETSEGKAETEKKEEKPQEL